MCARGLRALIDDRRGWRGCRPAAEYSPQSGKNAEGQRLVAVQVPRVIRVVNRTTKEGEQCARLLSFRGRRCGPRPSVLVWKSRHSATSATLTLGMPVPSAYRRAVPRRPAARTAPASPLPGPQLRRAPRPGHGNISSRCVPKLPAMARYRPDAFTKGSRTRKTPVRGNILPACIQIQLILARYACYVSQKAPQSAAGEYAARTSCHQGAFSSSEALKSCMAHKSCHPLMNLALAQG